MAGGGTKRGSRRQARADSVVVPFPRDDVGNRLDLARLLPSGRSLLVGFALVAAVLLAYWGARSTSVFAVDTVEVEGALPPAVERQVRGVVGGVVGTSLLSVDAEALEDAVRALPTVAGVSVDRAFPHTLVVAVAAERPVAVVRRGASAWLVTGGGDVVREIETGTERSFPRLWVTRDVSVRVGGTLPPSLSSATRALAAAHEVGLHNVKAVRPEDGQLALVLRRGLEIRLGSSTDLGLKLLSAASVIPQLENDAVYVDVSVPGRPVASRYLNP